ncbi:putative hemoglobin and hemoglobin-haptoglobin-binding protein 1 precursor, partial [Haemophilus influenzae]
MSARLFYSKFSKIFSIAYFELIKV